MKSFKNYNVKKTDDISLAEFDYVNCYPWGDKYTPETAFRAVHTDDRLIVSLRCYEKDPVITVTEINGCVCNDSCIEFFFTPYSEVSDVYFNFEVNANPAYLFEYRWGDRQHICTDCTEEELGTSVTYGKDHSGRDFWQVDFAIPYAVIRRHCPDCDLSSGSVIRANVYKCGCINQEVHYGTWSLVETEDVAFHIPEYFGYFTLE